MSELTDSQITKLNKPDLVILVKKLQADNASLKEDILEKLATITSTVQELKASNEVLHSRVSIQNTVNDKLMKRVVTLERELHLTEQYSSFIYFLYVCYMFQAGGNALYFFSRASFLTWFLLLYFIRG